MLPLDFIEEKWCLGKTGAGRLYSQIEENPMIDGKCNFLPTRRSLKIQKQQILDVINLSTMTCAVIRNTL
jgi:hypothetical protein